MSKSSLNPVAAQAPAGNTAAVATLAAPTDGSRWVLSGVTWAYSLAPAGGLLTIAWTDPVAGAVQEAYPILVGGPGQFSWPIPKRFAANTGVVITLAAGGGTITGTVYPHAWTEQ